MDTTVYAVIAVTQRGPWVQIYYAPAWLPWPVLGTQLNADHFQVRAERMEELGSPHQGMRFIITEERDEDVDIEWVSDDSTNT